jgi:hypothetical protein
MSIPERGHDPGRLCFEVYDHHQPATGAHIPLEEALAVRALVGLAMVGRSDRREHRIEVRRQLGMASVRIKDVIAPRVGEHDDADPVRSRGLAGDRSLGHASARSTASASWSLG